MCFNEEIRTKRNEIIRRIESFPQGQFIAELDGKVCGVLYTQRIRNKDLLLRTTYESQHKLHDPNGSVMQLLSLAIDTSCEYLPAYTLRSAALETATADNSVREVVTMTRCVTDHSTSLMAGFKSYVAGLQDPNVFFHAQGGAKVLQVRRHYRSEDLANLGCGILMSYPIREKLTANSLIIPIVEWPSLARDICEEIRLLKMPENVEVEELMDTAFVEVLESELLTLLHRWLEQKLGVQLYSHFLLDYPTPRSMQTALEASFGNKNHEEAASEPEVVVRQAITGDLPALWGLELNSGPHALRMKPDGMLDLLRSCPNGQFVAELDGIVRGVVYTQRVCNRNSLLCTSASKQLDLHSPTGSVVEILSLVVGEEASPLINALLRDRVLRWATEDCCAAEVVVFAQKRGCSDEVDSEHRLWTQFHVSGGASEVGMSEKYFEGGVTGTAFLMSYHLKHTEKQSNKRSLVGKVSSLGRFICEKMMEVGDFEEQAEVSMMDVDIRTVLDATQLLSLYQWLEEKLQTQLMASIFFDFPTPRSIESLLGKAERANPTNSPSAPLIRESSIAVVGLACKLPGQITNLDELWRAQINQKCFSSPVPTSRWSIDSLGIDDPNIRDRVRHGCFVENLEYFDPAYFGLSVNEAKEMDPNQRLLLETVARALHDSDYQVPEGQRQTGVWVGISNSDYQEVQGKGFRDSKSIYGATGGAVAMAAGRISYLLGLQGPSMVVDSAHSSSLVALHQACQALRNRECKEGIVSGVNLMLSPWVSAAYARAGMTSPDGQCHTFDDSANGYCRGEGCCAVVLKRLEDAMSDGDKVYAVVRGSSVMSDGKSSSLVAPSETAQVSVLSAALRDAGASPHEVRLVEAHGTGTRKGDTAECRAISAVYGTDRDQANPLQVTSVKANIGHLEAAAGLAGLFSAINALRFGLATPNGNLERMSDNVASAVSGLGVEFPQRDAVVLKRKTADNFLVGVSSFGYSGTIAHAILDAAPTEMRRRITVIDKDSVEQTLWQFSGQDKVKVGTARGVFENDNCFRSYLYRCDQILLLFIGKSTSELLYPELTGTMTREEAELLLKDIRFSQPVAVALQLSLAETWIQRGLSPSAVFGHGLGEYAAAVVAGVMSVEDCLLLVSERARLIHKNMSCRGCMIGVQAGQTELQKKIDSMNCGEAVSIAAINGSHAVVVSGSAPEVERVGRCWSGVRLDSEYAFQSPLMQSVSEDYLAVLNAVQFHSPKLRFISSVFGTEFSPPPSAFPHYWLDNLKCPVRFHETLQYCRNTGIHSFMEIGVDHTLSRLTKRSIPEGDSKKVVHISDELPEAEKDSFSSLYHASFVPFKDAEHPVLSKSYSEWDSKDVLRYGSIDTCLERKCAKGEKTIVSSGVILELLLAAACMTNADKTCSLLDIKSLSVEKERPGLQEVCCRVSEGGIIVQANKTEVGSARHGPSTTPPKLTARRDYSLVYEGFDTKQTMGLLRSDGFECEDTEKTVRHLSWAAGEGEVILRMPAGWDSYGFTLHPLILDAVFACCRQHLAKFAGTLSAGDLEQPSIRCASLSFAVNETGVSHSDEVFRCRFVLDQSVLSYSLELENSRHQQVLSMQDVSFFPHTTVSVSILSDAKVSEEVPRGGKLTALTTAKQSAPFAFDLEDVKRKIRGIFKLNTNAIDISGEDKFFDIGLDSLSVHSFSQGLADALGLEVSTNDVFNNPSLHVLALFLHGQMSQQESQLPLVTPSTAEANNREMDRLKQTEVAIVGISCKLPGGVDELAKLWQVLATKTDLTGSAPLHRWDTAAITGFVRNENISERLSRIRFGAFLADSDLNSFPAAKFGMNENEAKSIDVQHKLLLQCCFDALSDAGEDMASLKGRRIGVFIGCAGYSSDRVNDLKGLHRGPTGGNPAFSAYDATSNCLSTASGRISYLLGLTGPSLTIDTACSSSLVALHYARRSVQLGECELAVVAGVNVLDPLTSTHFAVAGMTSPDGKCHTFDETANGYCRGEGCGAVVLRGLEASELDKQGVYAVVRGSAVLSDGSSASLTAPNGSAQEDLLLECLSDAGLAAKDVCLLEAHGTGTNLGDPVEVEAIARVLGRNRELDNPLFVTGAKGNIGHLEAAAGMVGLFSAVLSLFHATAPPNAHLQNINSAVAKASLPGYLHFTQTCQPLTRREQGSLVAGVSSFGFSGTIAHVLIMEAPSASRRQIPLHTADQSLPKNTGLLPSCPSYNRILQHFSPCSDTNIALFKGIIHREIITDWITAGLVLNDANKISIPFAVLLDLAACAVQSSSHLRPGPFSLVDFTQHSPVLINNVLNSGSRDCSSVQCEVVGDKSVEIFTRAAARGRIVHATAALNLPPTGSGQITQSTPVFTHKLSEIVEDGTFLAPWVRVPVLLRRMIEMMGSTVSRVGKMELNQSLSGSCFGLLTSTINQENDRKISLMHPDGRILISLEGCLSDSSNINNVVTSFESPHKRSQITAHTKALGLPGLEEIKTIILGFLGALSHEELSGDEDPLALGESGLTSLDLEELTILINDHFDLDVSPTLFFSHPSLDQVALFVDQTLSRQSKAIEIPENPTLAFSTPARLIQSGEVAVVGIGMKLGGGIDSLSQLWDVLLSKQNLSSEVPIDRWDHDCAVSLRGLSDPGADRARFGTFLKGNQIDDFDSSFFNINATEASVMGVTDKLLLKVVHEALVDAGYTKESVNGLRVGVFVGIFGGTVEQASDSAITPVPMEKLLTGKDSQARARSSAYGSIGSYLSVIAGRISYCYGWQGPCVPVDTACSSSLVALHYARCSLQRGECDLAVAAGVNVLTEGLSISCAQSGMTSPDGQCHTFDESANGYCRGEGCGAVVLKRLGDLNPDVDSIYSVVKGSAVMSDGKSMNLVAPNGLAQQRLLQAAHRDAGIRPGDVTLMECHGTGTRLGDPIETDAISQILGVGRPHDDPLLLTSVKGNLGHMEAAAGMAGLFSAILSLTHGVAPPNAQLRSLNAEVRKSTKNLPLVFPTEPTALKKSSETPLMAGVSSLGYGGTIAHVIVQEPINFSRRQIAKVTSSRDDRVDSSAGPIIHKHRLLQHVDLERSTGNLVYHTTLSSRLLDHWGNCTTADGLFSIPVPMLLELVISSALAAIRHPSNAQHSLCLQDLTLNSGEALDSSQFSATGCGIPSLMTAVTPAGDLTVHGDQGLALAGCKTSWQQLPPPAETHKFSRSADTVLGSRKDDSAVLIEQSEDLSESFYRLNTPSEPFDKNYVFPPKLIQIILQCAGFKNGQQDQCRASVGSVWVSPAGLGKRFETSWVLRVTKDVFPGACSSALLDSQGSEVLRLDGLRFADRPDSDSLVLVSSWEVGSQERYGSAETKANISWSMIYHNESGLERDIISPGMTLQVECFWLDFEDVGRSETSRNIVYFPSIKPNNPSGDKTLSSLLSLLYRLHGKLDRLVIAAPPATKEKGQTAVTALRGAVLSAQTEYPAVEMVFFLPDPVKPWSEALSEGLEAELRSLSGEVEVLHRDGARLVRRYRPVNYLNLKREDKISMDSEGTFIITGGLGALGLKTARVLVALGVKKLVLVSRSGKISRENQGLSDDLAWLAASVAEVSILKCDVSKEDSVVEMLTNVRSSMGKVAGVVHAAGVLRDALVRSASAADGGAAVWGTKAESAWFLHHHTLDDQLKIFIVFSSIAAVVGNPGQASYTAANRFLDELCHLRQRKGLPASSIQWPPIADVGMAAALESPMGQGLSISSREFERVMRNVLLSHPEYRNSPVTIVPKAWLHSLHARIKPQFSELHWTIEQPERSLVTPLAPSLTAEEVVSTVRGVLSSLVKNSGELEEADLLDLDSLESTVLTQQLSSEFGLSLPPTFLFNYSTPKAIVDRICFLLGTSTEKETITEETALSSPLTTRSSDAAIVGMSCKFPASINDLSTLWHALSEGRDLMGVAPPGRWDTDAFMSWRKLDPNVFDRLRYGAFLAPTDLQSFDHGLYHMSEQESARMDLLQQLLLTVTHDALLDAGLDSTTRKGLVVGVFVGASGWLDAADVSCKDADSEISLSPHDVTGKTLSIAAGRISHCLDLQGPCLVLDGACSSSAVALHSAKRSLEHEECQVAVVVSANVLSAASSALCASAGMTSPDGKCHTFDETANGYCRAEGCGAVVLKRLEEAEAIGDGIYAVVRGSAVMSDGKSSSLVAPNGLAQQKLIETALRDARVKPQDICLIEAHGTGTKLGDPIEVEALAQVFSHDDRDGKALFVTGVKGNLGHLEAAAGIAGLFSVVLALNHRAVPPNAQLRTLNPAVRSAAAGSALAFPTELKSLRARDGKKLLAGLSCFGFNGSIAHIVLEEPPQSYRRDLPGMSGATDTRLFLDFSTTLAYPGLVWLFSGEGSDLGLPFYHRLYQEEESFKRALSFCDTVIRSRRDYSPSDLLFPSVSGRLNTKQARVLLQQPQHAHPALVAFQLSLAEVWRSNGVKPSVVMGHGLGEYTAAVVGGVLSVEHCLRLVCERSALLQQDSNSVAVTVSLRCSATHMKTLLETKKLDKKVFISAINSDSSISVIGQHQHLNKVLSMLKAPGTSRTLAISHALYTPLVGDVAKKFTVSLRDTLFHPVAIKMISCVTGKALEVGDTSLCSETYWTEQLTKPVQFQQALGAAATAGAVVLVEFGGNGTALLDWTAADCTHSLQYIPAAQ